MTDISTDKIKRVLKKHDSELREKYGIKELYLLTTTAEELAYRFGFSKVGRNDTPKPIQATEEFYSICPSSAACMVKRLDKEAQYYPKEILHLQPDVPGAKIWGIALKKTMLT